MHESPTIKPAMEKIAAPAEGVMLNELQLHHGALSRQWTMQIRSLWNRFCAQRSAHVPGRRQDGKAATVEIGHRQSECARFLFVGRSSIVSLARPDDARDP
jgi:hypothetical protein